MSSKSIAIKTERKNQFKDLVDTTQSLISKYKAIIADTCSNIIIK